MEYHHCKSCEYWKKQGTGAYGNCTQEGSFYFGKLVHCLQAVCVSWKKKFDGLILRLNSKILQRGQDYDIINDQIHFKSHIEEGQVEFEYTQLAPDQKPFLNAVKQRESGKWKSRRGRW